MSQDNVRHLRRVTPPLASYLRVGQRDAGLVGKLLEQGFNVGSGVIVDPIAAARTNELRTVAVENGVEVILDTKAVELSTLGGHALGSNSDLPWAADHPHTPSDLIGAKAERVAESIAETAIDQRVTGVLAPTHLLDDVHTWLDVDVALAYSVRDALDRNGAGNVTLYYPLVMPLKLFRNVRDAELVIERLTTLARGGGFDGVFLRIQGFGTNQAGPLNLRNYLVVARALHDLKVPVVGERTGTVGVALAAFGGIGGVESSVTFGETYDARRFNKPPNGTGFIPPPRLYLTSIMHTMQRDQGAAVLDHRGFRRLGCSLSCCARSSTTIENPRRHFIVTRAHELNALSAVPVSDRSEHFLATVLQPARDNIAQVARVDATLIKHRDRLDDWNLALRRTLDEDTSDRPSTALAPTGARLRRGA